MSTNFNPPYKRIVLTGPESTGKTTLAKQLSESFQTVWIPEFAREYGEEIDNKFNYEDVLDVARMQLVQELEFEDQINKVVFFDTCLIITKVWLDVVFKKRPKWIDDVIVQEKADLYLLCAPDIEWIPDRLRVNGGAKRLMLFEKYLNELEYFGCNYKIIYGKNENRFQTCLKYVNEELKIVTQNELITI